ncbi:hypothetical protein EJB05_56317, partial [Eragrostis curvula]
MSSCALPALLLLLVVVLASAAADIRGDSGAETTTKPATALDQVCGGLGGYYVTPGLCTSALCSTSAASDPCRAARDAPAVAALAARLAARNATAAQRSIQAAANATSPSSSSSSGEAVRSCLRLYAGAVPALHWAAASVAAGRYGGATEVLQMAQNVAAGCEGIVAPGGAGPTALPPENGRFGDMVLVAHAVVASMATTY